MTTHLDMHTVVTARRIRALTGGVLAETWLAELEDGSQIVIKELNRADPRDANRIVEEARRVRSITSSTRSQNIVELLFWGIDQNNPNLVRLAMHYYSGGSLADKIQDRSLNTADAVNYVSHVLAALIRVHGSNILHYDIKPANVLIDPEGQGRLADFGLSLRLDPVTNMTMPQSTTPCLYCVDALRNLPIDAQADLHQVGVLLFWLLHGTDYFVAEYNRIDQTQPNGWAHAVAANLSLQLRWSPHVTSDVKNVVTRLMQPVASRRYAAAATALQGLNNCSAQRRFWDVQIRQNPNGDLEWTVPFQGGRQWRVSAAPLGNGSWDASCGMTDGLPAPKVRPSSWVSPDWATLMARIEGEIRRL